MFGLPARSDVQIGLVPQDPRGLHGIVLMIRGEFLEGVKGLLIDQEALLDPTFDSGGSAHPRETLFAFQNFDAVAILHVADAVKDGRHLVAQRGLRRRDIGNLQQVVAPASTRGEQEDGRHYGRRKQPANPG